MLSVVVDTNVFIDILFKQDELLAQLFDKECSGELRFIVCEETVGELLYEVEHFCKMFKYTKDEIFRNTKLVSKILARSENVVIKKNYPRYCEDEHDDMFIECAIKGKADYVLSSDGHITCLPDCTKEYYGFNFEIIDVLDFLANYNKLYTKKIVEKGNKNSKNNFSNMRVTIGRRL